MKMNECVSCLDYSNLDSINFSQWLEINDELNRVFILPINFCATYNIPKEFAEEIGTRAKMAFKEWEVENDYLY